MPDALYALEVAPGRVDDYRRLGDHLRRNRAAFGESRRRLGIQRHASWLAYVAGAPWSVVLLTADDFVAVAERSRTSNHEFDVEWRAMARRLWGEQAWDRSLHPEPVLDVGSDDLSGVVEFMAGARLVREDERSSWTEADCASLGLDRLLVVRQQRLLLSYASGGISAAYDSVVGSPCESLVESLYALPLPEPLIAWTDAPPEPPT